MECHVYWMFNYQQSFRWKFQRVPGLSNLFLPSNHSTTLHDVRASAQAVPVYWPPTCQPVWPTVTLMKATQSIKTVKQFMPSRLLANLPQCKCYPPQESICSNSYLLQIRRATAPSLSPNKHELGLYQCNDHSHNNPHAQPSLCWRPPIVQGLATNLYLATYIDSLSLC